MELVATFAVYGYMNDAIFKVFGVAILIFNFLFVVMFALTIPRVSMSGENVFKGQLLFLGFLLISSLIAVGLIYLHRWAAVTASAIGLVWSLSLAVAVGQGHWQMLFFGVPVIIGMLLPFYATVRGWSSLKSVGNPGLKPCVDALRSLDRFHLE